MRLFKITNTHQETNKHLIGKVLKTPMKYARYNSQNIRGFQGTVTDEPKEYFMDVRHLKDITETKLYKVLNND